MPTRSQHFSNLFAREPLDALIVGGGISGAPLYHRLCGMGYRTAIVDRGDFASGTSQSSGLLVWGGLLYLKNLDLATVRKLCLARNRLLAAFPEKIRRLTLTYLHNPQCRRHPLTVRLGLWLYWLLGSGALQPPRALSYQEGMLRDSDSRFVLDWIAPFNSEHCAPLNYCRLARAEFDRSRRLWRAVLRDELTGNEVTASARMLLNCAGAGVDAVNRTLGVTTPCKHVFSKGVYLAFANRDGRRDALIFPTAQQDDVLTCVPWGPVLMWGPTETAVPDCESARHADRDDTRFLLEAADRHLGARYSVGDVVSVRCGVRALVVPANYSRKVYPLELSRRHEIIFNREQSVVSVYGGKLTSCVTAAAQVARIVSGRLPARHADSHAAPAQPETFYHAATQSRCVTARWSRRHEFCVTLDDYLRRRSNLAQWTPRMGLGRDNEHREQLLSFARELADDEGAAQQMLADYEQTVIMRHDPLLKV